MRKPLFLLVTLVPFLAACDASDQSASKSAPDAPSPAPSETTATQPSAPEPAAPVAAEPAPAPAEPAAKEPATATEPAAAQEEGTFPGDRIVAFKVEGMRDGKPATHESRSADAVTVYCVTSTTCGTTALYAPKLKEIETAYAARGVQFVWLYSNRAEADAEKTSVHAERGFGGLLSFDKDALAAKALEASKTPELVVTAKDGTVVYRGAVDDGAGDPAKATVEALRDGIEAALAGRKAAVENIEPAG